jgi:exodeoxyribonuclease V alpha subunit
VIAVAFAIQQSILPTETGLEQYQNGQQVTKIVIPTIQSLYRESTGFGLYVCEDDDNHSFTIKGEFVSALIIGQTYSIQGKIETYRGNKQIFVNQIQSVRPVNRKGIVSYLQTLKGLKSKADEIYDKFGDKSIDLLIDNPMQVAKAIRGIGQKSVMSWQKQIEKMKDSQVMISRLLGYGLSIRQARNLHEKYKDDILTKIEHNPYFLSHEVRGYGFERCDRIARSIGYDPKSNFRIRSGILHILQEASTQGHTYLPMDELITRGMNLLSIRMSYQEMKSLARLPKGEMITYSLGEKHYDIDRNILIRNIADYEAETRKNQKDAHRYIVVSITSNDITGELPLLFERYILVQDDDHIYLRQLYQAEKKVAQLVTKLSHALPFKRPIHLENELSRYLTDHGITLENKQREAVLTFASERGGFFILNGSAGCGKTFTLKIILALLEKQYIRNGSHFTVKVFAPTGKASKVATKATGIECMTVHRGLGYHPQLGFTYNEENPLEADVIVVDESSMLDTELTVHLLSAIQRGTKVIFIGDTKQLPSVGAGNVLHDLISSGAVNVVTLDVVKRQGALSGIIKNANRIIAGELIQSEDDTKDAYVLYRDTPSDIQNAMIQSTARLLKSGYALEDIQVLAPQRTGVVGTYLLNYLLQERFNPGNDEKKILNQKFQVTRDQKVGTEVLSLYFKRGDKVIHTHNDYDMKWYARNRDGSYSENPILIGITNGECGVIEDIATFKDENDDAVRRIIVRYDNGYVFYDDDFKVLDHAYALTIHKSQGSQWKVVILVIAKQHYVMLDNNLLYTGYTRAELFNVTVGNRDAVARAVETFRSVKRYTSLVERLQKRVA